jgi:ABC-type lipoprotein release transport system permease subunit
MAKMMLLAWRNLWRNWRRTAIALVAIVIGLTLLIFFDGMIRGSDQAIFGNAVRIYGGNLQVHAPGYRERASRLPLIPLENHDAMMAAVREEPTVMAVAPRINTSGIVSKRGTSLGVAITAIDPMIEAPLSLQAASISQGRFLDPADRDAILIGKGLADRLGVGVGDSVNVLGRRKNESLRQHTMTIVGVYNLGMPDIEKALVYMPLADAQILYNLRGQATEAVIFLKSVGGEEQLMGQLQGELPAYEVDSWQTLRPEFRETLATKLAFTTFIGLVVIGIAAIGILNLMLMAAFERTREMGVLAALGMRGWQIMGLFLLEGALIGVVGAVIGCALGALLIAAIASVGIDLSVASGMGEIGALMGNRLIPITTPGALVSRGLLVVLITAIASLYPAWQASRVEPAAALHHV